MVLALKNGLTTMRVGWFLAKREIQRSNKWATALISLVMTLTFLNLIVVRGILIGLTEGAVVSNRERYSGNIFISTLTDKNFIEQSFLILKYIHSIPGVKDVSPRYVANGKVEAGYRTKVSPIDQPESTGAVIVGVDPETEMNVTNINKYMIEGEFLTDTDKDMAVLGSNLVYKYTPVEQQGTRALKEASVGSKIRITLNGKTVEVTVKGILKTKVSGNDSRIFMLSEQVRQILGRDDLNVNEMAVRVDPGSDINLITKSIRNQGFEKFAKIQSSTEALPKFITDVQLTFNILGNLIGSIGLVVASITIFIVIFVNAITRRKFIGILKGIGINARAIQFSYVIQSGIYALAGIAVGLAMIYGFIKPFFDNNPINFPFSDGTMVATPDDVLKRVVILIVATMIAGYVPARLVIRQNTLDAILGR